MLTRRRFLGYGGAGMLAITAGYSPQSLSGLLNQQETASNIPLSLADKAKLAKLKNLLLGYPVNMNTPPEAFFDWRRQLLAAGIGTFAYNNVGNPNKESAIPYNTHDFEREVILRFGKLFAFPAADTWGFISNSGTDSNMHGMYMGRTILKARTGVLPKAYFTKEAHYSIQILRDLLGLETVFVGTLPDGGMDPDDLRQKLADNPSHPALVIATIGTTFKGAIDQVDRIQDALKGYSSYLHLDAALFGGYLPFTSHAGEVLYQSQTNPAAPRYDSIAVSCHKFFGFPSPAGLFITTQNHFDEFNKLFSQIHDPEYIHHVPGTITCSRDAVKPAEFYFFSTPSAMDKLAEDAQSMLQHTVFLMEQMQARFSHLQPTRANDLSNTVFFRKPSDWIVKKYSLATMHLEIDNKKQEYAHVVVMPHANRKVLTEFLTDLGKVSVTSL
ncbi:MAG: pyridoxal-dependent decarboxylase [Methylobacter sp.]|jgi:histidine decarboxylase|nr:pyridoxal-dependent decarboxylase [Methylobacter sp.]